MRSGATFLALGMALSLGTLALAAQKPPAKKPDKPAPPATQAQPKLVPWTGKLAPARARAKERNVPILVHVLLEKEEASDQYRDQLLKDRDLLEKSAECLVIIANNGVHAKKSVEEGVGAEKQKREVCAVYPMFRSCGEHQATWDELFVELQGPPGVMRCPQTAVFAPDGKIAARIDTGHAPRPDEVIAEIVAVQGVAGPGLTEEELETVKKELATGAQSLAAKAWTDAWKSYSRVLAIAKQGPFAEEARKQEPHALAGMKSEFARICALLVPGSAAKGYQELTAFVKATAGTPLEAEASLRLKKVEADKALLPEINAWKLGVEADRLLQEARDLFDAKQDKQAAAVVRKLLGKKFAATAAAETARKLWPEIAAEGEAKK